MDFPSFPIVKIGFFDDFPFFIEIAVFSPTPLSLLETCCAIPPSKSPGGDSRKNSAVCRNRPMFSPKKHITEKNDKKWLNSMVYGRYNYR